MPEKRTIERAKKKAVEGDAPTTQAGEFVREEIEHVREGKHGARSAKQAIAIGLSKARRAGIPLPPRGRSGRVRGKRRVSARNRPSPRRARAVLKALKREPRSSASHRALSREVRQVARARGPQARRRSALKAVRTKGPALLRLEARKAARSRRRRR